MYEYHVTFSGSKKKKIKLENKEDIESSIREAFQIDRNSAITLQMYDKEWEDFVNVEDELPDRAKLQVILSFPITIESAQVTATIPVVESTPAPAESLDASIPSTSKDATQVESVGGTAVKDDSAPVATGSGKPIPLTYSLPSDGISAALRRKLQSKERLSSKERSELLAALYNDVTTSYKFYLDPNEYDILARSLLRDYPHLSEGINHRDAVVSWHRKVKDKFKNTRKRADRGQPDVKKRLAIYPRGAESGKANRNVWGLPNFLPNRSAADDNHTIEGFKKELQMQSKYKDEKRDQERINRRMDATFPDRRVDVVVKALPIREIKSSYPILFSEKEISREFSRLADIKLTVFNEGVQRYAHRIVQLQTKNKVPDLAQRLKEKAQECETEAERNDAICMQAVLQVPTLLNENISALFKAQEDEDHATPYILALNPMSSGAVFKIIAEGEEVCSTTNLLKAFRLLVATFYVFNYVYPKCAISTLTFFQKVFLNLQDESRPNHKVINLMKKVATETGMCVLYGVIDECISSEEKLPTPGPPTLVGNRPSSCSFVIKMQIVCLIKAFIYGALRIATLVVDKLEFIFLRYIAAIAHPAFAFTVMVQATIITVGLSTMCDNALTCLDKLHPGYDFDCRVVWISDHPDSKHFTDNVKVVEVASWISCLLWCALTGLAITYLIIKHKYVERAADQAVIINAPDYSVDT